MYAIDLKCEEQPGNCQHFCSYEHVYRNVIQIMHDFRYQLFNIVVNMNKVG